LRKIHKTTVKNRDAEYPSDYNTIMGLGQMSMKCPSIGAKPGVFIPSGPIENTNRRTEYTFNEYDTA
jgi:hypothetical protein